MGLHGYALAAPANHVDPAGLKACRCPGGVWNFRGVIGGASAIVGYQYARVTAFCKKAEHRANRIYDCGDGICISKPIHCYCKASLSFHVPSLGIQVGAGGLVIFGTITADTMTDETLSGGLGWSASFQVIIVGVEVGGDFSGDPSGDYGGGGIAPGLDIGANLNWTFINVRSSELVCKRKDLFAQERATIRNYGPCPSEDQRIEPPEIVRNPYAPQLPESMQE